MHSKQTRCPDLIILDLNLPRKPGRDVLKSIRAGNQCAQVPIVVLTSSNNEQDRYDAKRLGASLFLHKPSRLREFLELGRIFKAILGQQL
jgi:DNA-binding response OmpR family regulator